MIGNNGKKNNNGGFEIYKTVKNINEITDEEKAELKDYYIKKEIQLIQVEGTTKTTLKRYEKHLSVWQWKDFTGAVKGEKGSKGKDGLDGANGKDGINGKDGADGLDGLDGLDVTTINDRGYIYVRGNNTTPIQNDIRLHIHPPYAVIERYTEPVPNETEGNWEDIGRFGGSFITDRVILEHKGVPSSLSYKDKEKIINLIKPCMTVDGVDVGWLTTTNYLNTKDEVYRLKAGPTQDLQISSLEDDIKEVSELSFVHIEASQPGDFGLNEEVFLKVGNDCRLQMTVYLQDEIIYQNCTDLELMHDLDAGAKLVAGENRIPLAPEYDTSSGIETTIEFKFDVPTKLYGHYYNVGEYPITPLLAQWIPKWGVRYMIQVKDRIPVESEVNEVGVDKDDIKGFLNEKIKAGKNDQK